MIFIYLLEGNDARRDRASRLLEVSRDRGDRLFTSHLAFGELLVGAKKARGEGHIKMLRETLPEMGSRFLNFDAGAIETLSWLRAAHRVKIGDAIHLASAASVGMDLFLTGDKQLTKLDVPGIGSIADFEGTVL